ncbi:uncharacterized protein LOC141815920 [Curcuma longa]|uniref:uncharacterized protein LOC141815920 n=1 Tax=Curcuma longa TaxID=136217 RepID=UPI003D9DBC2D
MICDVPELRGDNYKIWKERTLLYLGCKDIDYAIRKDEPPPENIALYEKWERSNCFLIMFIKTKILDDIRGSLEHYNNVRDLLKTIDDQFVSSDKALASTLIHQFSSMKLSGICSVHDHIMRIRDIAAQLKKLEVEMSNSFLEGRLAVEEGEKVNLTTPRKKKTFQAKDKGKTPAKRDIQKSSKCFFCKKKGHLRKDCAKFK